VALLASSPSAAGGGARSGSSPRTTVEAYFAKRSYLPDTRASLEVSATARRLTIQVFRAGPETRRTRGDRTVHGLPVDDPRVVHWSGRYSLERFRSIPLALRYWPSGLYFARVMTNSGAVAFAPFVLRAPQADRTRVAVVMPTNSWQAYNFRDDDGDGMADTWYASDSVTSVRLDRPFANHGVPYHFRTYDLGFIRWLAHTHKQPDFVTDDDLERFTGGARLAKTYDLIVFSGHEEYVTPHEYALITEFRDAGGNLAFLSADNFFYRVIRRGDRIYRESRWRDLGHPEARLIGVQYVDWNQGIWPNRPYIVNGAGTAPWLFHGTGLHNGSRFGKYGVEIDARTPDSPLGTEVLATIPDVFGPGKTAEMTYYALPNGAKVFAAGTINFGGTAQLPPVRQLLENLWARLIQP